MTTGLSRATVAAVVLSLGLTGCSPTPDATTSPTSAPLVTIACPADVEAQFVSRHECAALTVPQDHGAPSGRQLTLLVLTVWPVGTDPKPGISTRIGANPGDPEPLGGDIAAGATRSGRMVVQPVLRGGTSNAGPSLACPEVDAVATASVADRDAGVRDAFQQAVSACAARLHGAGVDPALFDAAQTVEDLEALRTALGEDAWGSLGSYGTSSRALLTYLDRHPSRVGLAVLDSPASADLDPLTAGVIGLDSALAELARTHPRLPGDWRKALSVVGRTPLTGRSGTTVVVVDDAKLVRLVRGALGGDGPANATVVPAIIAAAARGELHRSLAALAASDPPFCAGYVPLCRGDRSAFSLGLFLTDLCEQLPGDRTTLEKAIAGRTAYRQAFGASPYLDACAAWGVPAVEPVAVAASDTPALLLSGGLDSFSRPEWSEQLAERLGPRSWSVAIPGHTHNVLGSSECAISLRNAWRERPTVAPAMECRR